VGFGDGPINGANTASPTVGNGTSNSATQEMIDSPFESITLANSGDKIVFTGSVILSGTVNSPATSGNPRTQFRFGLFDGDETGSDDNGWVGYYMSNRHGDSSGSAGTLARKPVGNSSAYLSTTGQNSLATLPGDSTAASLFHDDTYTMFLAIERSDNNLIISASLNGSNGFTQLLSATDTTAATLGSYTFDHLGFLLGQNLGTDLATFSNLQVAFFPATVPGDYNINNSVDAADYVLWRNYIGPGTLPNENGVSPGAIDQQDYTFWRSQFGISLSGSGSERGGLPTPENLTAMSFLAVFIVRFGRRRPYTGVHLLRT